MEQKDIYINGKERKIVININEDEIENNLDYQENNALNDTIELSEIIETINANKDNE